MHKKPAKLLSTSNHLLIILFIKKGIKKVQKKLEQIKRNELYAMWWVVTYK